MLMDTLHPQYIVGFVDGEGSFVVAKSSHNLVRPKFCIANTNKEILAKIKDYFGFGNVYGRQRQPTKMHYKEIYQYYVSGIYAQLKLVEFFDKYTPIVKFDDYSRWRELVLSLRHIAGKPIRHTTPEERKEIVKMYLDGIPYPEIKKKFGLSISGIENVVKRAGIRLNRGSEKTQFKKGNYPARWLKRST